MLINNATETACFQKLLPACAAICLPAGRVTFLDKNGDPTGSGPLQGQAAVYFGDRPSRFARAFGDIGFVFACRSGGVKG